MIVLLHVIKFLGKQTYQDYEWALIGWFLSDGASSHDPNFENLYNYLSNGSNSEIEGVYPVYFEWLFLIPSPNIQLLFGKDCSIRFRTATERVLFLSPKFFRPPIDRPIPSIHLQV
jgi:hypothetical protein